MEAIFITDATSLIFEYPVSGSPPPWTTISDELDQNPDSDIVQSSSSSNYVIYRFRRASGLTFVIVADPTVSPAVPAQFVQLLTDSMAQYFVLGKLDSNYDTVTLILSETLDNGAPYLSEPDQVREFVSKGGVLSKLLSQTPAKVSRSEGPYWRRHNVRHTQNELFVDIEEAITCVVRRQGSKTVPVVSYIDGSVFLTSHLSGVPEIELSLSRQISGGKHVCITKSGPASRFRFTPPDGRTRLLTYTQEVNVSSHLVNCTFHTGLGLQKDEFEVRVGVTMNRGVKAVDNLAVEVFGGKIKTLRNTTGDFITSPQGGVWNLGPVIPMGFNATFRGICDGNVSHVTLKYGLQGAVPSGLKVDSVNIVAARGLGEGVKPYKGVKYATEVAEYVVR
ncbi:AP-2 complex subunit mu [Yarrowia sp. B02]|nr:AP-2 complex subunit mu [Yarrowia sp. B02]